MPSYLLRRFVLLLALAAPGVGSAQAFEEPVSGAPLFTHRFEPPDMGLEPQNWAVVQDLRGLIFVGNNRNIGVYDGREWHTVAIPNQQARSLAQGPDGRIYVGGLDELGYLAPDSLGQLRYVSLRSRLPTDELGEVWKTWAVGETVVFQTRQQLLFWDGAQFDMVSPEHPVSRTFVAGETLYVHLRGQPLQRWQAGSFEPVEGAELLASENLFALHEEPDGSLLLGTREGEFYRLRGGIATRLSFPVSALLQTHRPYAFAVMPSYDGKVYAIGTFGGGVLLIDDTGNLLDQIVLREEDLVLDLLFDTHGGLWAALYDGLVRVDALPSVRRYGVESGLRGIVSQIVRHGEAVFAATALGVYRKEAVGAAWEPVLTGHGQAWALNVAAGRVLAATSGGLFDLTGPQPVSVVDQTAYAIHEYDEGRASSRQPHVFVGLDDGIELLSADEAGGWVSLGRVEGVGGDVFAIGRRGETLWVTLADGEVIVLDLEVGLVSPAVTTLSAVSRPPGRLSYTNLGREFAVVSEDGIYRIREGLEGVLSLVADQSLNEALAVDGSTYLLLTEIGDTIWAARGRDLLVIEPAETGYERQPRPDLPVSDLHITHIAPDGDTVWLATEDGLLHYDPTPRKNYGASYPALIRSVSRGEHLVFGGAHGDGLIKQVQTLSRRPVLEFSREALRFEVAAASYNAPERLEYQYLLEGFDADWSAWTTEPVRTYTNLPERALYTFRVRARNVHGVTSQEARFALRVLPPWYRSIWAYVVYVTLAVVSLWALTAYRVRAHRNELSRERMVGRRLARINGALASANQQLADADTLKTSLLQNASHELRTPLTAMLGSAELLAAHLDGHDEDGEALATSILAGTERLSRTVQDMMDVANLQAGTFVMAPDDIDVGLALADLIEMHREEAIDRGLYLKHSPEQLDVPAVLDAAVFGRIVRHLMSNALKFTESGGVSVTLDSDADYVYFRVTDTGTGIPPERLVHVREAFTQQSSGHARSHEGTGLGLYIVATLVERMGGLLQIESEPGRGTTVSVSILRYDRRGRSSEGPRADEPTSQVAGTRLLVIVLDGHHEEAFTERLRQWGAVYVAATLRAAVSAARQAPYDAIVIRSDRAARALAAQRAVRAIPGYEQIRSVLVSEAAPSTTAAQFSSVIDPDTNRDGIARAIAHATDPLALLSAADAYASEAKA